MQDRIYAHDGIKPFLLGKRLFCAHFQSGLSFTGTGAPLSLIPGASEALHVSAGFRPKRRAFRLHGPVILLMPAARILLIGIRPESPPASATMPAAAGIFCLAMSAAHFRAGREARPRATQDGGRTRL